MLLNFSFTNDAVGYIIDGDYDVEAIKLLEEELLKKFQKFDHVSLYLEDSGIESFSLSSIINTMIFPFKHRGKFRKVALVTDRKWIHMLASLNDVFMKAEVRNFRIEDRQQAIDWIEGEAS